MTTAPVMMGEMVAPGSHRLRAARSFKLEEFSGLMDAVPQVGADEGQVERPHRDQDCERAQEEQPSAEDHAPCRTTALPIPHFLMGLVLAPTVPVANPEPSALTESGADTPPRGDVGQEHGPTPGDSRERSPLNGGVEAQTALQADDDQPAHPHHPASRSSAAPTAVPTAAADLPQAAPALTTLRGTAVAVRLIKEEVQDLDAQPRVTAAALPVGATISLAEPAAPVHSPAQQVAQALSSASAAPGALLPAQESPLRPPVQVLKLSLQPRELGQLRLTLRFTGDALDLKVETETPEALRSLERDKAVIGRILLDAGVSAPLTRIEVRMGQFEPAVPSAPGGADPDVARHFSGSSGGDPHHPPQRPEITERRTSDAQIHPDVSVRPRRNGLYL